MTSTGFVESPRPRENHPVWNVCFGESMLPGSIISRLLTAGTPSLHYYVKEHPEIGMSSVEETDFFRRDDSMRSGSAAQPRHMTAGR
jgi:hypothetical protein